MKKPWYIKLYNEFKPDVISFINNVLLPTAIYACMIVYISKRVFNILDTLYVWVLDPWNMASLVLSISKVQNQWIKKTWKLLARLTLKGLMFYGRHSYLRIFPWKIWVMAFKILLTQFILFPVMMWVLYFYIIYWVMIEIESLNRLDYCSEIDKDLHQARIFVILSLFITELLHPQITTLFFFIFIVTDYKVLRRMSKIFPEENNTESKEMRNLKLIYTYCYVIICSYSMWIIISAIRSATIFW